MNKKLPEGFPFVLKDDEEIKQIQEFSDYWISNYGRVFSYKKNRKVIWKELNCKRNKKNEKLVVLSNNKIYKSFTLARLVFEYFCEEIKAKHVIIFKDGDNTNYYYKNLKQISKSELMLKNKVNKYKNRYEKIDDFTIMGFTRNGDKFLIDKEDYPLIEPYCWHKHQDGYMRTRINCYIEDGKIHNSYILIHNLIMGKKDGLEIDHLNGNPADNRKQNFKYKTHPENMDNIVGYTGNKIKGVYYNKKEKKWKALITYNKKKYYLGNFEKYEDAEREILAKRKELGLSERRNKNAKI